MTPELFGPCDVGQRPQIIDLANNFCTDRADNSS